MNRVRNQRQRVGGIAEDQFGDDEAGIERGADGKRPAETCRRMAVSGMVMRMGMIVMVVVVRHAADIAHANCEYYYSDTAISSSASFAPPTGNTMNCLPPAMYVIGAPVALAGSSISASISPEVLS